MYKVNDVIVYDNRGVYKICGIGSLEFLSKEKSYYTLQSLEDSKAIIYIPTDKQDKLCQLISEEQAVYWLSEIPNIPDRYNSNPKERDKEYSRILQSRDCMQWIEMLKGIRGEKKHRKSNGRNLNVQDESNLRKIEKRISVEFSAALRVSQEEVEERIDKML